MQQKKELGALHIPEGVSEFYVNSLSVVFSPWDITLLYGSVELPGSLKVGDGLVQGLIRIDAVVRMSPQHAKASAAALATVVEAYEKQFGLIPVVETQNEAS